MGAVPALSDFGAQENKACHCFYCQNNMEEKRQDEASMSDKADGLAEGWLQDKI